MTTLQDAWRKLPPAPRKWLRRQWFEQLSRFDTGADLLFLNHGYAFEEESDGALVLDPRDEPNRYPIQLYHVLTRPVALEGLELLEVGCGRGGGADWLARTQRPRRLVATDCTRSAIRFCRRSYRVPGLCFEVADAHALPFADESFDVVLNLESSLLYDDVPRFFGEVRRVLRPGGRFLFADYRKRARLPRLREQLAASGLEQLEEEEITSRVVASMLRDSDRKRDLIARHAPRPLRTSFERFAGVRGEGDAELRDFETGARRYLRWVLARPGSAGEPRAY